MNTVRCGGCAGLGSHARLCPAHPEYHPWSKFVMEATNIGDSIGANDAEVANTAYRLAYLIDCAIARSKSAGRVCDTCGPGRVEPHPRNNSIVRCANCKEHLG